MIKTVPSPLRVGVITLFVLSCLGPLIYLWLAFGGAIPLKPKGYRVQADFPQANTLVAQADVRISGINVGKIASVSLGPNNTTKAVIEIKDQFAPIPRDTRAILRLKSLLGETYVELTPGNRSAGMLSDGADLAPGAVAANVQIDEILQTFDPQTRLAWRTWMQAQAAAVAGRGEDINAFFGTLPDFIDSGQRLLATLDQQPAQVRALIANTGGFFSAISARRGELSGLVRSADRFFQTTAQHNQQLADFFRALPAFETQSRLALPALTAFAQRSDPVVRQLQPIATLLASTFGATNQIAPQFRGLFERIGPTVSASQAGLPAFDRILSQIPPLLADFQPFLRNANPMVRHIALFAPEITGFFANVTAASLGHDVGLPRTANEVHYVRTAQTLTPQALAFFSRALGINRDNAYRAPGAFSQLTSGLPVLEASTCANGDVAPPTSAIPATLAPLVEAYAFRTTDRNVARPSCVAQGPIPGYTTLFPQLKAEP
jgi:phospholipid/cholesterol/gamma-HCH transport system substrate-binding protein